MTSELKQKSCPHPNTPLDPGNDQSDYVDERDRETKYWQGQGVVTLGVARAFPVEEYSVEEHGKIKPKFNGKKPSYLNEQGIPQTIYHESFQKVFPTQSQLDEFFVHPETGLGLLMGHGNKICIDLDLKDCDSEEHCDQLAEALLSNELLKGTDYDRTPNGGYHIFVEVEDLPDFSLWSESLGGRKRGEARGAGEFAVTAPTPGYRAMSRGHIAKIKNLAEIGVFPVRSEKTKVEKQPKPQPIELTFGGVDLLECCTPRVQGLFSNPIDPNSDRSQAMAMAANELYGWENWLTANNEPYLGDADEWVQMLADKFGVSDKLEQVLKPIDRANRKPACVYKGGDESARKKVAGLKKKAKKKQPQSQAKQQEEEDGSVAPELCKMLQLEQRLEQATAGQLRLNQLGQQLEFKGQPIKPSRYKLFTAKLLNQDVNREDVAEIMGAIGEANAYHPVKIFLEEGHEKYGDTTIDLLDKPSTLLLKTTDPMADVFLRNRLIGSVARIYHPGCKLDEMTVLHGLQGTLKSTFWKELFGEEFFSDSIGRDLDNKDELLKLPKAWGHEIAELDHVTNFKETAAIKAWSSRSKDSYRAPYERTVEEHPRMCSIVASVNKTEFLVDETGNRRFQVISVDERIDIAKVRELREQIWAGAVARYKRGDSWHLTAEEAAIAAEKVKRYESTDLWENPVAEFLENEGSLIHKDGRKYVLPEEVLHLGLHIEIGRIDHSHKKRLSPILRKLGWEPANNGQPIKLPSRGNRAVRAWVKVETENEAEEVTHPSEEQPQSREKQHDWVVGMAIEQRQNGNWSNGYRVLSIEDDIQRLKVISSTGQTTYVDWDDPDIRPCEVQQLSVHNQNPEPSAQTQTFPYKVGDRVDRMILNDNQEQWDEYEVQSILPDVNTIWVWPVLSKTEKKLIDVQCNDPAIRPAIKKKYPVGSKVRLTKKIPGISIAPGEYVVARCNEQGSIQVLMNNSVFQMWISEAFFSPSVQEVS